MKKLIFLILIFCSIATMAQRAIQSTVINVQTGLTNIQQVGNGEGTLYDIFNTNTIRYRSIVSDHPAIVINDNDTTIGIGFIPANVDLIEFDSAGFSSAVTGLTDVGSYSVPIVFKIGTTYYLISGNVDGTFNGFVWGESSWSATSLIVSDLVDARAYSAPRVFTLGAETYLIVGNNSGTFSGYILNQ